MKTRVAAGAIFLGLLIGGMTATAGQIPQDQIDQMFGDDHGDHGDHDDHGGGKTPTVPEPGTVVLLGSGLITMGLVYRARRGNRKQ